MKTKEKLTVECYGGNFLEDAVVKVMSDNSRYVVFYHKGVREAEFLASRKSKVAYAILDWITKEEYDTFGITWKYGMTIDEKIPLEV